MTILGIDPGSARMGYGLIQKKRSLYALIAAGTINLQEKNPHRRLVALIDQYEQLLDDYRPELVAIEKLFFSKNVRTGIAVAESRGAVLLTTARRHIPIVEYGPMEVKQAITTYGRADKKAVAMMVARILNISPVHKPQFDDTSDALAIALTASMATFPPPTETRVDRQR